MSRRSQSTLAKLRDHAASRSANHQLILRRYAVERLLCRLCVSPHRNRFVLKGAMLFIAWSRNPFRPSGDLDLLGQGDSSAPSIRAAFNEICQVELDDEMEFDTGTLRAEPIREGQRHGGIRVRVTAFLGKTRIPVQVDIGFGDVVTPAPQELEFPSLLAARGPRLKAYPKETVVSEKLQAVVALGLENSRMKDFYDLMAISKLFPFDGTVLAEAISATFAARATPVPEHCPSALTTAYSDDPEKRQMWNSFIERETLLFHERDLATVVGRIGEFVMPAVEAARTGDKASGRWDPDQGWLSKV